MSRKKPTIKTCKKCGQTKTVSEFHKYDFKFRSGSRHGCSYSANCLDCRAIIEQNRVIVSKRKSLTPYRTTDKVVNRNIIETNDIRPIRKELRTVELRWTTVQQNVINGISHSFGFSGPYYLTKEQCSAVVEYIKQIQNTK